MPCLYNAGLTRKSIESVCNERDVDLLLVDNGAEQGVKDVLYEFGRRSDVTVLANEQNIYVNPAFKQVIEYFMEVEVYDYLILLNSDVAMHPSWSMVLKSRLAANPDEICLPTMADDIAALTKPMTLKMEQGREITGGVNGAFMVFSRKQVAMLDPFPDEIKLWFGDEYAFELMRGCGFKTIMVPNLIGFHFGSQNIGRLPEAAEVIEQDKQVWAETVKPRMLKMIEDYNNQHA